MIIRIFFAANILPYISINTMESMEGSGSVDITNLDPRSLSNALAVEMLRGLEQLEIEQPGYYLTC